MSENRTAREVAANKFDLNIFNMIEQSDDFGRSGSDARAWQLIAAKLRSVRIAIRDRMHPEDRKITS